ncbi:MAG TPA: LamG-like jellyroll fold domain-containing protein [Bacteroidia bacterium]|nr:LamG-like jellyroll fold domain-containing protein [Bacteroidia bacterium]
MKKTITRIVTALLCLSGVALFAQPTPDVLYYKFDGSGTSVPNMSSNPPAGTTTATIMGGLSQGPTGQCGGALIGSGNAASTDYLNTNWQTNLTSASSWTISFWTSNVQGTSTLYYIFGDVNANSFRCFTNGVALANNWILRGTGLNDVLATGGAQTTPTLTTFVYDAVAGNIYAYVNGTLVNTVAEPGPFSFVSSGPFKVMGYSSNVGMSAGGLLDEFRLYSYALTPAEVASLMTPATYNTLAVNACSSYLSPAGNTYTTSGTYMDTIPNSGGCDSVITINLTVNQPSSSTMSATACGSYTAPSGAMFTSSGTYMDTIPNALGCDSVITINLTVNQPSASSFSVTACSSYTSPSGMNITSSGMYMDTIPNAIGCDSVMTIDVTINNPTSSSISPMACDSFMAPSGTMYYASGTYTDIIPNAAGCDSVITISLTVNNSSASMISPVVCDSFAAPSGTMYYTSGTYTDIIPNMTGCDSVITINLTVNTPSSSSINVNSCGPYTAPSGAVYTSTGTYTDMIPNMAGCDSVITIALTVNSVNTSVTQAGITLTAAASGATYQWIDCSNNTPVNGATSQSFTPSVDGSYAVIVMQNSCTDTSNCFSVTGVGIRENTFAGQITVFPNPNNGDFTIDLGATYADAKVIVTDVTGRVVLTQDASGKQVVPVVLNAPAGVYSVEVTAGDHKAVLRLVKE